MPSIDWYLDQARAGAGLSSDRELGRRLGLSGAAVNQWRTKRYWPSDRQMIPLAELAGVAPEKALLDLNSWRVKDERARAVYLDLAAKVVVLILAVFVSNNNALAASIHENKLAVTGGDLYIMRYFDLEFGHRLIHKSLIFRHPCAAPSGARYDRNPSIAAAASDHGAAARPQSRLSLGRGAELQNHRAIHDRGSL